MKLSWYAGLTVGAAFTLVGGPTAQAGGMLLPGSGAVSTSRAGAAVASASDGEALGINPAGIAKAKGTTITVSMAIISYALEFTRAGTYDAIADEALPYEGSAYPTVRNDPDLKLGFGSYQPIPVIAIVSDLGGLVPNLTVAAGLYAPNAYPFRRMCTEQAGGCRPYTFNGDFNEPPPPSRYDVMSQDAEIFVPTIAAAYSITPQLDVGGRFGVGYARFESELAIWGGLGNVNENVKQDALFKIDAKDTTVPAWGLGATFRPTPTLEFGVNYTAQMNILAKGDADSVVGPSVGLNGVPVEIGPVDDDVARCAPGGAVGKLKGCAEIALPMSATVGGRYKFLGADGRERGDVELNVGWENWSAERATDYRVVVDGQLVVDGTPSLSLKDNLVRHGLQDTFSVRVGGSYHLPVAANELILRGGVGYDTKAAKDGWLRVDIDGTARTTATVGVGYRTSRWEINAGGGAILAGTVSNGSGTCNPTTTTPSERGCNGDGNERPIAEREGADPINPVVIPESQLEAPSNHGSYSSHYVMFMLGFSTWF